MHVHTCTQSPAFQTLTLRAQLTCTGLPGLRAQPNGLDTTRTRMHMHACHMHMHDVTEGRSGHSAATLRRHGAAGTCYPSSSSRARLAASRAVIASVTTLPGARIGGGALRLATPFGPTPAGPAACGPAPPCAPPLGRCADPGTGPAAGPALAPLPPAAPAAAGSPEAGAAAPPAAHGGGAAG